MTTTPLLLRSKRIAAALLAALVLATAGIVLLAATPASADTRYERVLVETNCRYVTQMGLVPTYEHGYLEYVQKPTQVWTCDRAYQNRAYRHTHWYHVACVVAGVAGKGRGTAIAGGACGALSLTHS